MNEISVHFSLKKLPSPFSIICVSLTSSQARARKEELFKEENIERS